MAKTSFKRHKLHPGITLFRSREVPIAIFIVVFAVAGGIFLFVTKAATPTANIEPESGTVTSPAVMGTDATASGGRYIQFKAGSVGTGGNPTGNFYIVGKDIIGPDGNKFYPIGANVGIQGFFDWRGVANGHANDALAWGWNTVRLTILCTNIVTTPATDAAIDNIVQEYTAKKIVVMIECHDMTMGNVTDQYPNSAISGLDTFWTRMAQKYKTNPYVWFNPENEPFWSNNTGWVQFHQHYISLIRGQGAENIIVADNMNMGNDAGWNGAKFVYDSSMGPTVNNGQCNVVFSMHAYGGAASSVGTLNYFNNVQAANLPLLIGEFGYGVDGSSFIGNTAMEQQGANEAFQYGPAKGIGLIFWHGTHGDMYSVKNNGNAFWDGGNSANLSPAGQKLWNIGQSKPNLGAYTGTYAPSNCSSAAGH